MEEKNKLLEKIKNKEKLTEKDIHSGEGLKTEQRAGYKILNFEKNEDDSKKK